MVQDTLYSLGGFLDFLLFFGLGILLTGIFWRVYICLTPHDEMALVRENNVAAAIGLSGALLGFALPHLSERIGKGEVAAAVLTAALSISVGLINASAMTYW